MIHVPDYLLNQNPDDGSGPPPGGLGPTWLVLLCAGLTVLFAVLNFTGVIRAY